MFFIVADVKVLVSLISLSLTYHVRGDDIGKISLDDAFIESDDWRSKEDKLFAASGICSSENRSYVETCDKSSETVSNLFNLRRTQCFCDDVCHMYHDCCIDYVLKEDHYRRNWTCREVRNESDSKLPIYVLQSCPLSWTDAYLRSMCETEASVLDKNGEYHSYLQDIPVKSEKTGVFYRNVFCAICNGDNHLVKWKSYFYCAGISVTQEKDIDFSKSTYNTRTQMFQNVKIGDNFTNCRVEIEDFNRNRILTEHGGRLCKPMVESCGPETDAISRERCSAFTSFVYEYRLFGPRKVYKNFHCAICNGINVGKLRCRDPLYPQIKTEPKPTVSAALSFLFDFNFEGGNNQVGVRKPCKLSDGKIWDPVLKECSDFVCGFLFERNGSVCVPRTTENNIGALNSSCPKIILYKDMFQLTKNQSVFINSTAVFLSLSEYEIHKMDGKEVVSIAVCADEGSFLLQLSRIQYWLSEITLSLSIICLIVHLFVYSVLKSLRNCPGKILMSLSTCLLCGHIFLLIGKHIKNIFWMCYACAVFTHFGYLSSFLWMNVMAYDIYKTFSTTQTRNSIDNNTFIKYSVYCWITSITITTLSLLFDNAAPGENMFRPKYGNPICWFNQRKGLLIFFILPIVFLLLENIIFFTVTAFRIRRISQQTKMVNSFSDKVRYFLYVKLSVVFGLTWLLGIVAGIFRVEFLWYPFIILNGLQGVFIFIAFTVKRKIIKLLLIKFKVRSDTYKMGKKHGFKQAMYSSLSNLSTMQTTLTVHLPALNDNPQILKAVRRINPDLMLEDKKSKL